MNARFFIIVFSILLITACSKQEKTKDFELTGNVFGTTYKIVYLNGNVNYQKELDSIFGAFNKSVSTYLDNSLITQINNGDTLVKVDPIFKEVFKKSKKIHKETNGYFDPTVGNLVNAYGFGPEDKEINLSKEEVSSYMEFVGLDKVTLVNNTLRKEKKGIYLDFNSIAKGFGIDAVARFFDSKNINSYLIEIGGEIRAKGVKGNEDPWVIKLVNPVNVDSGFRIINLSNKSMATSGNYRKFRVDNAGNKYVHTINPKTGLAQESNLLSASVIAESDCADVDAYATAFMAMGLEKTKAFLEDRPDLKVILIYINDKGLLEEYTTYK